MHKKNPYIDIINANGHDFVEIGGVKWATCNLGAEKPWEAGLYFQWGDIYGYRPEDIIQDKNSCSWQDYKFGNYNGFHKYSKHDRKLSLDLEDDAAHVNWGGGWRMPTTDEYAALGAAVDSAWTEDYQGSGVSGLVLTDKKDSSKVLFFPAAGFCSNGSMYYVGSYGNYWSSSLSTSNVVNGCSLDFNSSNVYWQLNGGRYGGFAVRGVLD